MTPEEKYLSALSKLVRAAEELKNIPHPDPEITGQEDCPRFLNDLPGFVLDLRKYEQTQKTILNQLSIFQE